jgi:aspartate/methionine/tyrosine aminotransferase
MAAGRSQSPQADEELMQKPSNNKDLKPTSQHDPVPDQCHEQIVIYDKAKDMAPSGSEGHNVPTLSRRSNIDAFVAMDVLRQAVEREAAGQNVIHMEVGQPATPAPLAVRQAATRALEDSRLGYTEARGLVALRERIAQHYRETYDVSVAPERIIVTTGSSAGFLLAFLMLFDEGAHVALPQPGYPCYRQILKALGLRPVAIPAGAQTRWMPTPRALDDAAASLGAHLSGIIVASPANPTGTMLQPDVLSALIAHCRARGMWFISDEIYHGLAYAVPQRTALATDPNAIIINSFSKYYSMTGWRIGWMIVPDHLVRTAERLQQNLFICAPTLSQIAAMAAFEARDELERIKAGYHENRAFLLDALARLGLGTMAPADGAFYIYVDISAYTSDSEDFCSRLLRDTGVAITPGIDFDPVDGRSHVRLCYAGGLGEIREAASRLRAWLG